MFEELTVVDVEEIMKEIREDIKKKGYSADMLSFNDIITEAENAASKGFNSLELNGELYLMNTNWNIAPYKPLSGNKITCLFKRLIRRITRFIITPIVTDQSDFNAHTVRTMNQLNNFIGNASRIEEKYDSLLFEIRRHITHTEKLHQDEVKILKQKIREQGKIIDMLCEKMAEKGCKLPTDETNDF